LASADGLAVELRAEARLARRRLKHLRDKLRRLEAGEDGQPDRPRTP
jgi:hypothetical protein